jgi:hypothetical protein
MASISGLQLWMVGWQALHNFRQVLLIITQVPQQLLTFHLDPQRSTKAVALAR